MFLSGGWFPFRRLVQLENVNHHEFAGLCGGRAFISHCLLGSRHLWVCLSDSERALIWGPRMTTRCIYVTSVDV